MPKSKRSKIILTALSIFAAACFLFLCYLIFANYLAERDRQANLALWESQRKDLLQESTTDKGHTSSVTAPDH